MTIQDILIALQTETTPRGRKLLQELIQSILKELDEVTTVLKK